MSDDALRGAIEAMLDGNRVQFNDAMADLLASKAAEAVDDRREQMAQVIFNFEESTDDEEANEADESETAEVTEETESSEEADESEEAE